ncbi:DNA-directed DNA polymerase [Serendipita sp. 399]|nr:DNA-directed DNA polymerase [Serendipita sp. 399]
MIDLASSSSEITGSMSGQEERDMMFSRLFGLSAIAHSGLLMRETPLPHVNTRASTLQDYQRVLNQIVHLGNRKTWFRESCWWSLSQIISLLLSSSISFKSEALNWTLNELFIQESSWTPEKVAIWLRYQATWNAISQAPLKTLFKGRHPLTPGNLRYLSSILADIVIEDEGISHGSAGTWKPTPHFVWSILFDIYFPVEATGLETGISSFQDFFRAVVDEQFFSSTASSERKYIGFQVVDSAVKRSPPSVLPHLFTKNFVRTWINQLAKRDRYLHKAAVRLASTVQDAVQKEPSSGFPLIIQLLGPNGSRDFDRLTNTKIVETILGYMKDSQITEYIQHITLIFHGTQSEPSADSDQQWAINQLSSLIRSSIVPKSDSWVTSILELYVREGFFTTISKKKVADHLSENTRRLCRERLYQALVDLSSQAAAQHVEAKTAKFNGKNVKGEYWVSVVIELFRRLEKEKHTSSLYETDKEFSDTRSLASSVIKSLGLVQESRVESAQGATLLTASLVLHAYSNVIEGSDADLLTAIQDTIQSVSHLFGFDNSKKKAGKPMTNGQTSMELDNDEQTPFDLIVDDLLGYLEKPEPFLRTIAPLVFSAMCSEAQGSTVELLLTQLQKRDVLSDEAASSDESTASNDEVPFVEDEEEADQEDPDSTESETESSSSGRSSSISGDEDAEDVDPEFRKKVAEALGATGSPDSDSDSDSDGSSELIMDDDQMMELDAKLAEVFRSQSLSSKTKTALNLQREATHFKIRVLDLVEIFIRKQPQSPQIPLVVLPLIRVIMQCSSDEQQLVDKLNGLIRRRIGALHTVTGNVDWDRLAADLEEVHKIARKASHQQIPPTTLTFASIYLSKICVDSDRTYIPAQVYQASLNDYMKRKGCKIHHIFFADSVKRVPPVAWAIRRDFIQACGSGRGVNAFRQMQAVHWVDALLPLAAQVAGENKEDILATMQLIRETVYHSLLEAAMGEHPLTVAQAKTIAKMALHALRITARTDGTKIDQVWDTQKFDHVFAEISASESLSKGGALLAMLRQMATRLSKDKQETSKSNGKKRKIVEEKLTEKSRKKAKKQQK